MEAVNRKIGMLKKQKKTKQQQKYKERKDKQNGKSLASILNDSFYTFYSYQARFIKGGHLL